MRLNIAARLTVGHTALNLTLVLSPSLQAFLTLTRYAAYLSCIMRWSLASVASMRPYIWFLWQSHAEKTLLTSPLPSVSRLCSLASVRMWVKQTIHETKGVVSASISLPTALFLFLRAHRLFRGYRLYSTYYERLFPAFTVRAPSR